MRYKVSYSIEIAYEAIGADDSDYTATDIKEMQTVIDAPSEELAKQRLRQRAEDEIAEDYDGIGRLVGIEFRSIIGACVPVVYISPSELADTVGCSLEAAIDWLKDEDNLGRFREALYPDSAIYYDALLKAYEGA